jgi:hypothetical protein
MKAGQNDGRRKPASGMVPVKPQVVHPARELRKDESQPKRRGGDGDRDGKERGNGSPGSKQRSPDPEARDDADR